MIAYITFDDFIVFLEGLQIPVSGIDITYGRGTSICKINIVPNSISKKIWPLTRVHIFYRFQNQYQLLFDGRVIDVSYVRTPQRIETILTAADFTYFLGLIPIFFYTYDPNTSPIQVLMAEGGIISVPFGKLDTTYFQLLKEKNTVEQVLGDFFNRIFGKKVQIKEADETAAYEGIKEVSGLRYQYQGLYIPVNNDNIPARFTALTTSNIKDNAKQQLWNDFIQGALTQHPSEYTTIMGFIDEFIRSLGMTWYTFSGLPSYKIESGKTTRKNNIINLLILPYIYSARVPNCNIIAEMEYCQIICNKMQMPTRMLYILPFGIPATEGQEDISRNEYNYLIYPPQLAQYISKEAANNAKSQMKKTFYQMYYEYFTPEEWIRGINNLQKEMPIRFSQSENQTSIDQSEEMLQAREFAKKMLAYEFWTARYSKSTVYISMIFNPFIVPGIPALIYDKNNEYTGRFLPAEISHSISVTGVSTTISGDFYQNIEEIQKMTKEGRIVDPIAKEAADISTDLVDPAYFYLSLGLSYDLVHKSDNPQEFNMDNLKKIDSIKTWILFAKNREFINIDDFQAFFNLKLKSKPIGKGYYYFDDENRGYYNQTRRKIVEEMLSEILLRKLKLG